MNFFGVCIVIVKLCMLLTGLMTTLKTVDSKIDSLSGSFKTLNDNSESIREVVVTKNQELVSKMDSVSGSLQTLREGSESVREVVTQNNEQKEKTTRALLESMETLQNNSSFADVVKQNSEITQIAKRVETGLNIQTTILEKESKKFNAIIHNLEEISSRPHSDEIHGILTNISFNGRDLKDSRRLGKTGGSKPRLIKLEFFTESDKWEFLSRYNRLKQAKNSFATLDLTQEERAIEFELRKKKGNLLRSMKV